MDFLRSMPKIELHAHLSGSVPIGFLNDLISDAVKAEVDYTYDYFPKVHSVLSSRGPLEKAIQKVFSDFRDDGVVYLELRSSPRVGLDYSKEDYIRLLVQIIQKEAQDFSPMMVKFLISIDRSKGLKEAHENIELFLKTSLEFPQIIVGLDVGGDPTKGDIKSLLSLIKAKKQTRDFKVTIHCGEEPNSSEIKDIINFKPDRIGHGINVSPSDAKDIPWEVCLTSNIKTGGFQSYEDHVLKSLYENNIPFSICTDDSGFFDTILSTEYSHMKRSVIPQITNKDIFCIAQKSIDYIFSDDLVKNQLKQLFSDWENKNEKYF